MGYEICIRRAVSTISLLEWQAAVAATEGVRLRTGDTSSTNPTTAAVTIVRNSGGDAEVFFQNRGEWVPVFAWRRGAGDIAFKATREFSDPDSDLVKTVRRLALHLGARLVGDGGEVYD